MATTTTPLTCPRVFTRCTPPASRSGWTISTAPCFPMATSTRRIREDALTGMTSNPTIFEKALAEGHRLRRAARRRSPPRCPTARRSKPWRPRTCATPATRSAACTTRPTGVDGYVSLEVSPDLARDADGTVAEARRLWTDRRSPQPDDQGAGHARGRRCRAADSSPTASTSTSRCSSRWTPTRGSSRRTRRTRTARGGRPARSIASPRVASFFVSRVDTAIDKQLDSDGHADEARADALRALQGKAAIANAKLAYQSVHRAVRRRALGRARRAGRARAAPALGQHQHQEPGVPRRDLRRRADRPRHRQHAAAGDARSVPRSRRDAPRPSPPNRRRRAQSLAALAAAGISLRAVTDTLLVEGLASFEQSFVTLFAGLARKRAALAEQTSLASGASAVASH